MSDNPDPEFCKDSGMTMVMYMRGFFWSTGGGTGGGSSTDSSWNQTDQAPVLPCLNYYFRTWVLTDKYAFRGAMFYSFLLALLTQGLSAVRAVVLRHVNNQNTKKTLLVLLYTVQQTLGYLIMLIAMMYSIELLLAVLLGVMVGNRIFVRGEPPAVTRRRRQQQQTQTNNDQSTTI